MVMRRARAGETRHTIDRVGSAALVVAFLAGDALVVLAEGRWADAAGPCAEHPGPAWRRGHAVLRQEDPRTARAPVPAAGPGPGPSRMGCGQGTAYWRDIHAAGAGAAAR